jgi:hypothetical protein
LLFLDLAWFFKETGKVALPVVTTALAHFPLGKICPKKSPIEIVSLERPVNDISVPRPNPGRTSQADPGGAIDPFLSV